MITKLKKARTCLTYYGIGLNWSKIELEVHQSDLRKF